MPNVRVFCTECGQCLDVPMDDMSVIVSCPRCGRTRTIAELVPPSIPLAPVMTPPAPATTLPSGSPPLADSLRSVATLAEQSGGSVSSLPQAAFDPAVMGVALAARSVQVGARVAFWVDDHLYGWRRLLFTLLALLTACAYAAGAWLYAICLVALALVVYALLLARVWSLRDDDENWTWDHVRSQIRVSLGQLELPAISEIPRVVGSWLLTVGATTLATVPAIAAVAATLLRLASRSIDNETVRTWIDYGMWLAAIATALGTILYVRWWYRTHLSPHRLKLSRSLASEQVLFNAWRDNPTAFTSDRALQSVLGVLQSWRPRGCRLEKEYEASLVRHLRRRLPNLEVEQQHPLYHEGTRVGKVDIVIGGAFAFELKRAVTASEGDRAVGQVWKYLLTWEKGPVALLLCETRENKTEDLVAARLTELRGQQKPVMVIAAGKRLD